MKELGILILAIILGAASVVCSVLRLNTASVVLFCIAFALLVSDAVWGGDGPRDGEGR